MSFEKNVFINCPFDKEFKKYLQPLIFTVSYLGFEPHLSETKDSGSIRVLNIINLIKKSKYSIHDLSRAELTKTNPLARFNMPFELGLDIGVREAGGKLKEKQCLIIDSENYRYQKTLSDIAGSDIYCYNSEVEDLIRGVRNWFVSILPPTIPSGTEIWESYNEFSFDFEKNLSKKGYKKKDIESMKHSEYIFFVKQWISGKS